MLDKRRGYVKYLILAVLNIALIVWFISISGEEIKVKTTKNVLQNIDLEISFTVFLLQIILLILYSKRLTLIISCNQIKAATSCAVGIACNNVLPFRLGDGIRAAFTNIYLKIPISDVIFFMVVEKILDLSFVVSLFILVLFLSPIFVELNSLISFNLVFYAVCA